MIFRLLITLLLVALPSAVMSQSPGTVVVDAVSGIPLRKASVFDCNGKFIGLSSDKGVMPSVPESAYPLLVRYVGYEPVTVRRPGGSRVMMHETVSELPEVVVSSATPKALHILAYVRENSMLTTYRDTVELFREKMVDFMLPAAGVRNFTGWTAPRILSSRSYYHFRDNAGLDSVSDAFPTHFSWSDWVGVARRIPVPQALRDTDNATDTVRGRWSATRVWRRTGGRIYLDADIMADMSNRQLVPHIAGFISNDEIDFRRLDVRYVFDNCDDDEVTADNLSAMSFNIESRGRGRRNERVSRSRGPEYVDTYAELYVIDKEYIPIKEARKWDNFSMRENGSMILVPDGLPRLPASTLALIARVENIDTVEIRLKTEIDPRIGRLKVIKWDILSRLKRMARGFVGLE